MDYKIIEDLVKSTKQIILDYDNFSYTLKGKADFVTEVDIAISKYVKKELKKISGDVDFFSEEEDGGLTNNCWVLDPIDGTTNLIYGYNLSSVSLGHYVDGKIVYGIVYNPFTDELFSAEKGKGAYYNNKKKLQVSNRTIDKGLVEFGAGSTHKEYADINFEIACEIFKNCIDVRRICSSALDLCYIAAGKIDGYFEKILKPWDIAAGSLILTEAGGKITDYMGMPIQFSNPTSVIASNSIIHDYMLKTIQKYI